MKKVSIKKANGQVGILRKEEDGDWSIEVNGKKMPANMHYDDAGVERIIASAKAEGSEVVVE